MFPSAAPADNFVGVCATTYKTRKPMPGHMNMGNYVFCDGHAKAQKWGQVRANDFYMFKLVKPIQTFSP